MNPIKTSDIYQDTGELKRLVSELETVQDTLEGLRKSEVNNAANLESAIKKLNVTTSDQRDELAENAKQAEEIEKRYKKYTESLNDNAVKIAALKNAQSRINQVNKLQAKLASSLEGSYNALSAQYSLNKIRLNQMSKAQRETTEDGKKLEKETRDIYEEMKRLQEQTGKHTLSVGDYGKALREIPGPIGQWISGLQSTRDGIKGNITNLKGMVKGLNVFKVALASTGIGLIIVALGSLYAAFTKTQKGIDFVDRALAGIKAGFDVLIDRAAIFGGAIIKLFKGDVSGAFEDAKAAVSGIGSEIVEEASKGAELEKVFQNIRDENQKLEVQTARTRAEIKQLNKIAEDTTKGTKTRAKAAQDAFNLENDLLQKRQSLLQREVEAIKQRNALGETLFEDAQELADKETELANVREQSLELQTTLSNKVNILNKEAAASSKAATDKENERIEALKELSLEIETANAQLGGQAAVVRLQYDRAIAKIDELRAKSKSLGKELDFSNLELLEESKLVRNLDAILGNPTLVSNSLDKFKDNLTSQGKDIFKEGVLEFGSTLEGELGAKIPTSFLAGISKTAEKIKKESKSIFAQVLNDGGSIYDALGINLSDGEQEQLKKGFDFVKSQLADLAQKRVDAAKENVSLANNEIASAQNTLQAEIANRNAGFAHKVGTAQKELEAAKANQRKALKEQEKAQKQQLAIQSIQEAANLTQAAAKIFAQFGNPFISIPLVGLMIGSFIATKAKAFSLAKKKFGKGTYQVLEGGSHASGDDIPLGFDVGNKPAYAEGGEGMAIFSKQSTNKYKGILPQLVKAINQGKLEERFFAMSDSDSDMSAPSGGGSTDTSTMEGHLANIARNSQSKESYYKDNKGRTVRVRGNVKTTFV